MVKSFINVFKERTGMHRPTKSQIEGFKRLIKDSRNWDIRKARDYASSSKRLTQEEYDKLWDINSYNLTDEEKERLTNLDQATIFNNIRWMFENAEKLDPKMHKSLGMHVWVIHRWIQTVGPPTIKCFLREKNYDPDFIFFLYKYFNL
jgi:hypothetical protein